MTTIKHAKLSDVQSMALEIIEGVRKQANDVLFRREPMSPVEVNLANLIAVLAAATKAALLELADSQS